MLLVEELVGVGTITYSAPAVGRVRPQPPLMNSAAMRRHLSESSADNQLKQLSHHCSRLFFSCSEYDLEPKGHVNGPNGVSVYLPTSHPKEFLLLYEVLCSLSPVEIPLTF